MTEIIQGLTQEEMDALKAPFEPQLLKKKGKFSYIPITKITDRLDQVFNGNWDSRVVNIWEGAARRPTVKIKEYGQDEKWIPAHAITAIVELTVTSSSGAKVTRTAAGGACVELAGQSDGDAAKAAISSALAKAAWYLNCGKYLSEQGSRGGGSSTILPGGGGRPPGSPQAQTQGPGAAPAAPPFMLPKN